MTPEQRAEIIDRLAPYTTKIKMLAEVREDEYYVEFIAEDGQAMAKIIDPHLRAEYELMTDECLMATVLSSKAED